MRIIYVSESTSLCQRSAVHALTYLHIPSHTHILESCYLARIVHDADKLWPQTPLICPIICASSLQQSRVGECMYNCTLKPQKAISLDNFFDQTKRRRPPAQYAEYRDLELQLCARMCIYTTMRRFDVLFWTCPCSICLK